MSGVAEHLVQQTLSEMLGIRIWPRKVMGLIFSAGAFGFDVHPFFDDVSVWLLLRRQRIEALIVLNVRRIRFVVEVGVCVCC